MFKAVIVRFIKGIVAGAVGAMVIVTFNVPSTWMDFAAIYNALGIAAVYGATTGFLLALQKWVSWDNEEFLVSRSN